MDYNILLLPLAFKCYTRSPWQRTIEPNVCTHTQTLYMYKSGDLTECRIASFSEKAGKADGVKLFWKLKLFTDSGSHSWTLPILPFIPRYKNHYTIYLWKSPQAHFCMRSVPVLFNPLPTNDSYMRNGYAHFFHKVIRTGTSQMIFRLLWHRQLWLVKG